MQTPCFPGLDVIFSCDWKDQWQRRMCGSRAGNFCRQLRAMNHTGRFPAASRFPRAQGKHSLWFSHPQPHQRVVRPPKTSLIPEAETTTHPPRSFKGKWLLQLGNEDAPLAPHTGTTFPAGSTPGPGAG